MTVIAMDIWRAAVQITYVEKPAFTATTIPNAELANVATRMATARRVVLLSPEERSQALSSV